MGYGLGLGYRLMGFGSSFRQLNVEHMAIAYRKSSHRLIVVDYGGTLNVRESNSGKRQAFEMGLLGKDAAPPLTADTRRALKALSEDPRNTVFVISGKEQAVMQQAFAELPNVGLAAEHGFVFRWPAPVQRKAPRIGGTIRPSAGGSSSSSQGSGLSLDALQSPILRISVEPGHSPTAAVGGTTPHCGGALQRGSRASAVSYEGDNGMPWEDLTPEHVSVDWMALTQSVMDTYAARTNGTYILRKSSALSWHYGDADPEFGSMQAKELQDHLTGVLAAYSVNVLSGQNYVEVRPKGVHKGAVLALIMNRLEGRAPVRRQQRQKEQVVESAVAGSIPPQVVSSGTARDGAPTEDVPPSVVPLVYRSDSADSFNSGASQPTPVAPAASVIARKARPLEFILTIGDDLADEEMFSTVQVGFLILVILLCPASPNHCQSISCSSLCRRTDKSDCPSAELNSTCS